MVLDFLIADGKLTKKLLLEHINCILKMSFVQTKSVKILETEF